MLPTDVPEASAAKSPAMAGDAMASSHARERSAGKLGGGPVRARGRASALALTTAVIAVLFAVFAAVANAATYEYCNQCTINASSDRISASSKYSDLSYMHRLSGPSSGVYLIVAAFTSTSDICQQTSYGDQLTCDPRKYLVRGQAYNGGNGNYAFNAHLRY